MRDPLSSEETVEHVFFCSHYLSLVWKLILGPLTLFFMKNGIVVITNQRIWFYTFTIMGTFLGATEKARTEVHRTTVKAGKKSATVEFVFSDDTKRKITCPFNPNEKKGLFLDRKRLNDLQGSLAD